MGRLLDEDDVVDALEKVASFFPYRIPGKGETYDKYNEAWNDAIGRAEMEIEQLPPAQPEKTQLSGESTTKDSTFDCISRQATITEIKNYERDSTAPIDYVKIVEQMPPAQPDTRYINANELIKRLQQAGLDDAVSIAVKMAGHERLKHVPSAQLDIEEKLDDAYAHGYSDAESKYRALVDKDGDTISRKAAIDEMRRCRFVVDAIEKINGLPSAQPERDIPIKPNETTDKAWGIPKRQAVCPKCDYYLGHIAFLDCYKGKRITYCEMCGQAIDWEGWKFDE